jgi:DNA-binding transcriptional MerR regulator
MFSIGEFAGLGRMSVRMLRHYDAIGLLRPAHVDAASGYRFYTAAQLSRLNRIIALKDLGFTLQQVQVILDEKVDVTELRGMLRLRRAQLAEQLAADSTRLARVEARLRLIESEGHMNTEEVVLKHVPSIRIAELTAVAASYGPEDIGPTISPLYEQLIGRLEAAGVKMTGPPIAYYDPAPGDSAEAVTTHAAFPVAVEPGPDQDFAVVDLPAIETAATLIHRGSMDGADRPLQVVANWIDENGYRALGRGYAREVYLEVPPGDQANWVTEFQVPVVKA